MNQPVRMAHKPKRMNVETRTTKLTDEQINAIAWTCDSTAVFSTHSGQEGSLEMIREALDYEFGEMQAALICNRAPKFAELLKGNIDGLPMSGDSSGLLVVQPTAISAMSLNQRQKKNLTEGEINEAVNAMCRR